MVAVLGSVRSGGAGRIHRRVAYPDIRDARSSPILKLGVWGCGAHGQGISDRCSGNTERPGLPAASRTVSLNPLLALLSSPRQGPPRPSLPSFRSACAEMERHFDLVPDGVTPRDLGDELEHELFEIVGCGHSPVTSAPRRSRRSGCSSRQDKNCPGAGLSIARAGGLGERIRGADHAGALGGPRPDRSILVKPSDGWSFMFCLLGDARTFQRRRWERSVVKTDTRRASSFGRRPGSGGQLPPPLLADGSGTSEDRQAEISLSHFLIASASLRVSW